MERIDESRTDVGPIPLLVMSGLVKSFTATLALDHVNFDVRRGEVHALLGQNGAGKSTLIKILAGVYRADSGEIRYAGKPAHPGVDSLPISFIHQDLGLVEWMTVAENVAIQTGYPRSRLGLISWRRLRDAAAGALDEVQLGSDYLGRYPGELSGGERQRVAIARALLAEPSLLIADEVLSALDVSVQASVLDLLLQLKQRRRRQRHLFQLQQRFDFQHHHQHPHEPNRIRNQYHRLCGHPLHLQQRRR